MHGSAQVDKGANKKFRSLAFWAAASALIIAFPAPLRADAPELQVIDSTDAPWPSIGRVNVAGFRMTAMCTGTLIAPKIVLTAAHCLFNKRTQKPHPKDDLLFLAGVRRDQYAARLEPACVKTQEDFAPSRKPKLADIRKDAAILILKEASRLPPVPPLSLKEARLLTKETRFRSAGYRQGRRYLPTVSSGCKLLAKSKDVWITDCSTDHGASGGPLLVETPHGLRVAGITSAKIDDDRSAIVPFYTWQDLLKNASCRSVDAPIPPAARYTVPKRN
ncbi:trypsin-like serine peptidase [Roseibium sp.]|uniref:trypsin-like serine peptidase n=1 Tax=Roseibium sp. TaxID=1936156 RepID=UPI003D11D796